MHSASHRLNHDFQLRHFLAGSCHTPDAAWTLLYSQKIDMESKLKTAKAQAIDRRIKALEAENLLASSDPIMRLQGEKIQAELEASQYIFDMNVEGAEKELETITALMEELEPLCKYAHLPILERNEACWREEWCLELIRRAENNLLAYGTIPPDQLETMRQHPDFKERIVPKILELTAKVQTQDRAITFRELEESPLLALSGKLEFNP